MLKLGFTRTDLIEMPYGRAAWYVEAVREVDGNAGKQSAIRDATQADIDAF